MHPLKITIPGDFWDSHLYRGRLHLFDLDGSLRVVDWNHVIRTTVEGIQDAELIELCFLKGSWGYGNESSALLRDAQTRDRVFERLAALPKSIEVSKEVIERHTLDHRDSPFPYAYSDAQFYLDTFYVAAQEGVYASALHPYSIGNQSTQRLWEAPVSGIDTHAGVLGLAAGRLGLVIADVPRSNDNQHELLNRHEVWKHLCNDCDFAPTGILGFAQDVAAALVTLPSRIRTNRSNAMLLDSGSEESRSQQASQLFGPMAHGSVLWGSQHQVCCAKDSTLHIARWPRTSWGHKSPPSTVREVRLRVEKGRPIAGANAFFGAVLETDNCLVVAQSDKDYTNIWGEVTNWRLFQRSKNYCNQLHAVLETRLEIYAFVHDYRQQQDTKAVGEPFPRNWPLTSPR